jgi:DNA-binding winged helix-turn-helix (wHTH) protein
MPIEFGEFTLDEGRRELIRGGEPVRLSPKAFQLLSILVLDAPRAVSSSKRIVPQPAAGIISS